jgi:ribosomal protein L10
MVKSKRPKLVNLSKVKKRSTKERKKLQVEAIQEAIKTYNYVYTFNLKHLKTPLRNEIREKLKPNTKIFLTKKTLIKLWVKIKIQN